MNIFVLGALWAPLGPLALKYLFSWTPLGPLGPLALQYLYSWTPLGPYRTRGPLVVPIFV